MRFAYEIIIARGVDFVNRVVEICVKNNSLVIFCDEGTDLLEF